MIYNQIAKIHFKSPESWSSIGGSFQAPFMRRHLVQVEVFGAGAGGGIWCRWRCDYAGDAGGRGWERVRSDGWA